MKNKDLTLKEITNITNISSKMAIIVFTIITLISLSVFIIVKQGATNNITNLNSWTLVTMLILATFAIPNIVFFIFQIIFWIIGLKNENDEKKINHWMTSNAFALINSISLIIYFICFLRGNILYLTIGLTISIPLLLFYLKLSLGLEKVKRGTIL